MCSSNKWTNGDINNFNSLHKIIVLIWIFALNTNSWSTDNDFIQRYTSSSLFSNIYLNSCRNKMFSEIEVSITVNESRAIFI